VTTSSRYHRPAKSAPVVKDAPANPPVLLSHADLREFYGIDYSRAHLHRLMAARKFPRQVGLGPAAYARKAWRRADVEQWIADLPTRRGVSRHYAARADGTERRAAEVCSDDVAQLTDWPIQRITELVQPTDAQRDALDKFRAASQKAVDILKGGCPNDLPSTPTGRVAAMEHRLQVMLAAVQTVRPALERFYQSLSDEQKARFNAIAPTNNRDAAAKDRSDLTQLCDEKTSGATDLPIDRIVQAVQPTPAQRATLDELKDASVKAAEQLNAECPTYQTLTPIGRLEAMERRLVTTLGAVRIVYPPLAIFYNSLSDEQKARFNSLRAASRSAG
jgi:predicted DNA-binding transcriptional regulator AlpA